MSGRGWDSETDENSPKVVIILFSLSSSLMYFDGEVFSVLPGLYFAFRCLFFCKEGLGLLVYGFAFLPMDGAPTTELAGALACQLCLVQSHSPANKGSVVV